MTDRVKITICNFYCNHFVTKKSVDNLAVVVVQWPCQERNGLAPRTPATETKKRIGRGGDASGRMCGAEPWLGCQRGLTKTSPPQKKCKGAKKMANCEMIKTTIGAYLDDVAEGVISLPNYQRSFVWEDKQVLFLADSVRRGIPLPPVIVAKVGDLSLLTDGYQRTTALRRIAEGLEEEHLDEFSSSVLYVLEVTCDTAEEAATLFVRYNNGKPLAGIERSKATLSEATLVRLEPYTKGFADIFGNAKLGKVTADVAAIMLAGALVSDKPATSGVSAGKALAASGDKIPDWETIEPIVKAVKEAGYAHKEGLAYWQSPARLVPVVLSAVRKRATADDVKTMLKDFDIAKKGSVSCVYKHGKKSQTETKAIREVLADTSNAYKATACRISLFSALLNVVLKAKEAAEGIIHEEQETAAAAAAIKKAMKE